MQIATLVGCDEGTIRGRFSDLVKKNRAQRKLELKLMQWRTAKSGNAAMLIWLGKQELDQVDKQTVTSDGKIHVTVSYDDSPKVDDETSESDD